MRSGEPIGVTIIGLGVMGMRMLGSLTAHPGFHVASAWDPSDAACADAVSASPGLRIVDDAQQAIGSVGVDLVYIATPPHAHLGYARLALDAGLAVYCEKPLGVDLDESRELVTLVGDAGVPTAVNFPFAASPSVDRLQTMLADGSLGDVVGVDVSLHFAPWPREWQKSATWLADRADGGFLREVGSHFVFLTERLFGRASVTESSISYPSDGRSCETEFRAELRCAGQRVRLSGTSVGVGPDVVEFIIWGSQRSVRLSNWGDVMVSAGDEWKSLPAQAADRRAANNGRFFDDLERMMRGGDHTMATFDDAFSVQKIVEAIAAAD